MVRRGDLVAKGKGTRSDSSDSSSGSGSGGSSVSAASAISADLAYSAASSSEDIVEDLDEEEEEEEEEEEAAAAPSKGKRRKTGAAAAVVGEEEGAASGRPTAKRAKTAPAATSASASASSSSSSSEMDVDEEEGGQGQGGPRAGTVAKVTLTDFMCHEHFSIDFGPHLNMVVGENGSGKSAIMAALTIGLGGRATDTGRGGTATDFVRHGRTHASIKILLRNEGANAFRPDECGPLVEIERVITRGKSAISCVMRAGRTKKVISRKLATVKEMMAQFNVRLSNPITLLTQERSKDFLAKATPETLFKFFLDATMLSDLRGAVHHYQNTIKSMEDIVNEKARSLTTLENEKKRCEAEYREIESLKNLEESVVDLGHQVIWASVTELEATLEEKRTKRKAAESEEKSAKELLAQLEVDQEKADKELAVVRRTQDGLKKKLDAMSNDSTELSKRKKALHVDLRKAENEVSRKQEILDELAQRVERNLDTMEKRREQARGRGNKENAQRAKRIKELEAATVDRKAEQEKLIEEVDERTEELHRLDDEGEGLKARKQTEAEKAKRANQLVRDAKSGKVTGVARIHPKMPNVLAAIERERWGAKPVGPLGNLISVKSDFAEYTDVIEAALTARSLSAFVVTSSQDRDKLSNILRHQFGNSPTPVILTMSHRPRYNVEEKMFALPPGCTFVYHGLVIESDVAHNAVVDIARPDAAVLSDRTRDEDLRGIARTINSEAQWVYSRNLVRYKNANGVLRSSAMEKSRNSILSRQGVDVNVLEQDAKTASDELARATRHLSEHVARRTALKKRLDDARAKLKKCESRIAEETEELDMLVRKADEDTGVDVGDLLEDNNTAEAQMNVEMNAQSKFKEVVVKIRKRLQDIDEEQAKTSATQPMEDEVAALGVRATELSEKAAELSGKVTGTKSRYQTRKKTFDEVAGEVKKKEAELHEAVAAAEKHCARVEPTGTLDELSAKLAAQKKLVEEGKRDGRDPKDVEAAMRSATRTLDRARVGIDFHQGLVEQLYSSAEARNDKGDAIAQLLAKVSRRSFKEAMAYRGNSDGALVIDYENQTLSLAVDMSADTDKGDGAGNLEQVARDKAGEVKKRGRQAQKVRADGSTGREFTDLAGMSGGERSYATVCLLLSLWKLLDCPFIVIDEYDVFMDGVTRHLSSAMLVEASETIRGNGQTVLITPNGVKGMDLPENSRVFQLKKVTPTPAP